MVALRPILRRRLPLFHQSVRVDFPVRMPFAVGRRGYGVQYSHDTREALPVLRARMAGASTGHDRDRDAANLNLAARPVDVAGSLAGRARAISHRRRAGRVGTRVVGRVLEPLGLADPVRLSAYWNWLWESNLPTYSSSQSSSGSPSKLSIAAEADAAAVYPFASANRFPRSFFAYRAATTGSDLTPVPLV